MGELTRRQFIGKAAGLHSAGPGHTVPGGDLDIHLRSEWAIDRPPKAEPSEEDVRFLLVHHSASHSGHRPDRVPGILRSFYDFHTSEEKGWGDIAYNFLIDSAGGVWEGRSGSLLGPVAGDATGGNQGFSQLVCVIGDFNVVTPTKESMTALVALLAWLSNRYGLDTAPGATADFTSRGSNLWPVGALVTTPTITGHRTMSRTTCPGSNLNDYVTGPLMADVTTAREQARVSAAPVVAVEGPASTTTSSLSDLVPPTTSTTSTTIPATPPPTRSPLVLVAAGLATFATLLVIWRARRMGDD